MLKKISVLLKFGKIQFHFYLENMVTILLFFFIFFIFNWTQIFREKRVFFDFFENSVKNVFFSIFLIFVKKKNNMVTILIVLCLLVYSFFQKCVWPNECGNITLSQSHSYSTEAHIQFEKL